MDKYKDSPCSNLSDSERRDGANQEDGKTRRPFGKRCKRQNAPSRDTTLLLGDEMDDGQHRLHPLPLAVHSEAARAQKSRKAAYDLQDASQLHETAICRSVSMET